MKKRTQQKRTIGHGDERAEGHWNGVCSEQKQENYKYVGLVAKDFPQQRGSSSDTSRDSAKQEPKHKNNSMFMR